MSKRKKLFLEKVASFIISIAFLSALLLGVSYYQGSITFTDSNLETVIREKLYNPSGLISRSDLLQITHLDASGQDIYSLEGIEKLSRLVYLNLEDNQVVDLSPLKNLSRLTELELRNNGITCLNGVNFEAITGLPLRTLSLCHNVVRPEEGGQFRLKDISLISEITTLEVLELRDNHIENINPLSSLTNLEVLDLRENRIEDISALEGLTELAELNLRENEIEDISALSPLTNLTYLNLHSNRDIESVLPLKELVNLETLILCNVPVGDEVRVLENMINLHRLNLRDTGINDLTFLAALINAGALQDDSDAGIEAELNIRGNRLICDDLEVYTVITEQWKNISYRTPEEFPRVVSSIEPPFFSHPGGFYKEGFMLTLKHDDPEVAIYYTLDGSTPCPDNAEGTVYYYKNDYPTEPGDPFGELQKRIYKSSLYISPFLISEDGPRNTIQDCISTINTTIHSGQFDPPGNVFRGTAVRAVAHKDGYLPSEIITHSFFVGEEVIDKYHIPLISLVGSEQGLFDYYEGIYVAGESFDNWRDENPVQELSILGWRVSANYIERGIETEIITNIEYYGRKGEFLLNQQAGMRIHGNSSRPYRQKSVRLYSRNSYGSELFKASIFLNSDNQNYKRFIIRNTGNDWIYSFFRDALMQSLVRTLDIDRQEYQPVVVFVNGVYWGIYNIRERYDRYYLKFEYGVDPYRIDLLQHFPSGIEVREGDVHHYSQMIQHIEVNDTAEAAAYAKATEFMDVENFINVHVAQIFFGNDDWPGNNMDLWRFRSDQYESEAPPGHDGRWRWMLNDTDAGFGQRGEQEYTKNTLTFATAEGGEKWPNPDWSTMLLRNLLKNADFRYEFINRFADYMNTIFKPEVVLEQIDSMQDNLSPLMQEQIDRWGQPESYEQWEANVDVMRVFARNRPAYVRQHIIDKFDLIGLANVTLIADSEKGYIKINTIDIIDETSGVDNPSNWTGIYFKYVPITIIAIPEPGYRFAGWVGVEADEQELTITLESNLVLRAIFVEE